MGKKKIFNVLQCEIKFSSKKTIDSETLYICLFSFIKMTVQQNRKNTNTMCYNTYIDKYVSITYFGTFLFQGVC